MYVICFITKKLCIWIFLFMYDIYTQNSKYLPELFIYMHLCTYNTEHKKVTIKKNTFYAALPFTI